jgi:hypothetical protein
MSPEQEEMLKKFLQEKKSEDLPFIVQLEYNKTESEKYLLDIQNIKTGKNNPELVKELTVELAKTNPDKYRKVLVEKLSADPTYSNILKAMETI